MGASKRLAELILQAMAEDIGNMGAGQKETTFAMVRFGNVLDSSGSVVPKFRKQISDGGPVTITHRDMERYFMSISEAAQLVIQTATLAENGGVYVLDMGEPVKISLLARTMIELSGLKVIDDQNPDGDIALEYLGLRPGEKIKEELREELGITEENIKSFHLGEIYEFTDHILNRKWIVNPSIVEINDKTIINLNWEHIKYEWVKPEEIKKYDTVPKLEISLEKGLV